MYISMLLSWTFDNVKVVILDKFECPKYDFYEFWTLKDVQMSSFANLPKWKFQIYQILEAQIFHFWDISPSKKILNLGFDEICSDLGHFYNFKLWVDIFFHFRPQCKST